MTNEPENVFFLLYPIGQKAYKVYDLETKQFSLAETSFFMNILFLF